MSSVGEWLQDVGGVALPNVFNPYRSVCPECDQGDAARIRLDILAKMLSAASASGVDDVWLGRDLGYRGGRRTGLALTDDVHIDTHLKRWDVETPRPFLRGRAVAERTASAVWRELESINSKVFLWNVFPFHPHEDNRPMSNRAHTRKERAIGEELLASLLSLLRPRRIIAIGRDAQGSATRCTSGVKVYSVRHPSYGGQSEFVWGVRGAYAQGGLHGAE